MLTESNEIVWESVIAELIIICLMVALIEYVRKTSLNPTVKYSIYIAAIIFVFLTFLYFLGYSLSIIFSLIEWATKFVLPWIALYWLVRAIKLLDKKS